MSGDNIATVVASAGTGKTYRIVEDIADEVANREPEEIVATTFTVKAADELIERSRAKLFRIGEADKAARLLGARFGTVNAICGQLVSDYAIALGRSPRAEIISEGSRSQIFAIAADAAIERHAPALNRLADMMGFSEPKFGGESANSDWRIIVQRIIELARANGLTAELLPLSAGRSVETFVELLPEAAADGDWLDQELTTAIEAAIEAFPDDVSATAKGSVSLLRQAGAAIRRGERLSWPDWARLTKLKCAKKDGQALTDAFEDVGRAAGRHPTHPRLRVDCTDFIRTLFACASEALAAYQTYKAERGLLDFVDQEALALEALGLPETCVNLGERIGRLFVDEFQDSSPLQLAIFTAMAPLVDKSTWVGDPKQAIYGFRNADSVLTQAAFAGVAAGSATPQDRLSRSYRSREGIVNFVNAAFVPALAAMGLDPQEHAFTGTARSDEGFDKGPLRVWWLDGKLELQFAALAEAIRDAVAPGTTWQVGARTGGVRPMQMGDVAVLCRSGADIIKVAAALSTLGVKVAVEREGLARTPHVELIMSAFRWVTDPADSLALAELARFLSEDPYSETWLEALGEEDHRTALRAAVSITPHLEALRERLLALTPGDLIDAIALLPEVTRRIESWGDVAARFDDIEALRGFARTYEANCAGAGVPATPSGLVLALSADEPKRPRSLREDAVKVMTYHGAKGLEWPCVILTGLAKETRPRLWEPVAEAEGEIDWRDPLRGRWIRFWPWPYASLSKDVHLDASGPASPLGIQAVVRARDEEARLLYVGMTRARDHLILAPPAKGELSWLSVLDGGGSGHVELSRSKDTPVKAGTATFPAEVETLSAGTEPVARVKVPSFVRVARIPVERPALYRRPSSAGGSDMYRVVERIILGPRLPLVGSADMRLVGEAVHAIIAADGPTDAPEKRSAGAKAILDRWGVHQIAPGDVLAACDRLWAEIAERWPAGKLHRETPVSARIGNQLVNGRIDLLVEHEGGFAIVDHKAFPGSHDSWEAKSIGYGAQLDLYANALARARPQAVSELYIHMPILGALLRVAAVDGGD